MLEPLSKYPSPRIANSKSRISYPISVLAERAGSSTKTFARILTEEEFIVKSPGNFDSAMVTRGGVSLDEINLSTMELIKHPGIFVIGEALDIYGETGGYNLQFAYSSALSVCP